MQCVFIVITIGGHVVGEILRGRDRRFVIDVFRTVFVCFLVLTCLPLRVVVVLVPGVALVGVAGVAISVVRHARVSTKSKIKN